jgi:hypothetical protein
MNLGSRVLGVPCRKTRVVLVSLLDAASACVSANAKPEVGCGIPTSKVMDAAAQQESVLKQCKRSVRSEFRASISIVIKCGGPG